VKEIGPAIHQELKRGFATVVVIDCHGNVQEKKVNLYISHKVLTTWTAFLFSENISSFFSFEPVIIDITSCSAVLGLKTNPLMRFFYILSAVSNYFKGCLKMSENETRK
jgi:hypothetical protein